MPSKPWVFLAWAPYGRRSESLAKELGAHMHFVHNLEYQKPAYAPFKYVIQSIRTSWLLLSKNPSVVFIQNTPIFAALVVYLHSLLFRTRFVLDHHSDAFGSRWNWILPLQKFLVRRAAINLVTDDHWVRIIESWGGRAMVLEDALPEFPEVPHYAVADGFTTVMINTFAADEPLAEVLGAAKQLPHVTFYITGNKSKQPSQLFENQPDNVVFTGFLPDAEYIGLLKSTSSIMALTTRDHTLQGGGYEAVSVGKPLITSDWPLLRHLYRKGTAYVDNTVEGLVEALTTLETSWQNVAQEMMEYRQQKRQEWRSTLDDVTKLF